MSASNVSSSVPKPPGKTTKPARVADEHDLAREEVVELEPDVAVGVETLLERQLDVEADRERAGVAGAAVGGLHRPRAAARDDREAGLAERYAPVSRASAYSGSSGRVRAEPKNEAAGPTCGERVEAHLELARDARDARAVGERREDALLLGGDDLLVALWRACAACDPAEP